MNPWIWKSTTSDPGFRWWDLDKQNKFNTNIRKNTFSPFGHHILQEVFFLMQKNSSWKNTFSPYSRKMLEEFVGWGKMIGSMCFLFRLEEPSAVGSNVLSFARKAIYPQLTPHWLFTSPLQTIILQKNGSWTTTFFFHSGLFKGFSKANCEFLVSWKKFYLDITVEYPSYHSKTPLSSHWLLIDPESGQSQGHQCFFQVSFEIFPPI